MTDACPPPSAADSIVLGIETSCDETAAAIVRRSACGRGEILANVVRSQTDLHSIYGGVVPEIAARAHVECLDTLIEETLRQAGMRLGSLSAVAATAGPGLVGGLVVGLTTAKALALASDLPLIAVNHLEGHALTVGLTEGLAPPYLLLLVSGGHTQLLVVHDCGRYTRLGTTMDDALGEAFDKTAKLLGLGFPGGPQVEQWATRGDERRISLPVPLVGMPGAHFSFSGLKTAVRQRATAMAPLTDQDVADLCAAFQRSIRMTVADRVAHAMRQAEPMLAGHPGRHLVVAGGVAANRSLRSALEAVSRDHGYQLHVPPPTLCTDNGAMIAWAGAQRLARGWVDPLDVAVRPRWPLDAAAAPIVGAGRLGAKA
jgi:N6-L-threonylcarbamoyladenine synthase